jgi:hypothetical protein
VVDRAGGAELGQRCTRRAICRAVEQGPAALVRLDHVRRRHGDESGHVQHVPQCAQLATQMLVASLPRVAQGAVRSHSCMPAHTGSDEA